MHLFVDIATGVPGSGVARAPFYDDERGLAPFGFISIGAPLDRAYTETLHEIGHVLGIGVSPRWREHRDTITASVPFPAAIEIFDRDGGSVWTGAKVPIAPGGGWNHWNRCLLPQDVMSGQPWYLLPDGSLEPTFVTEVTAASLRPGYVYDRAQVRPAQHGWPLEPNDRRWCQENYGG